jgi:two-component system sensor histidine kinase GlrK
VVLEKVEIEPLVDMVISAHSLPARAKMMHTGVELNAPACLAEPMLLMSVLDNLYSNAVHYGTESGNIYIRSYTMGPGCLLTSRIPAPRSRMTKKP